MKKFLIAVAAAAVAAGSGAAPASASTLLSLNQPVTCSGYYSSGSEVFPCTNVDNGETGDTGSPYNWSFWLSPPDTGAGQYVTINLGAVDTITQIVVEDTHNRGYYDRGTEDFTIGVSNDGVNFTTVVSSAFTYSDWDNLTDVPFDLSTSGQYVQFTVVGPNPCFGCSSVGLNEMSVYGSYGAPVPEPASIALLGLGLAGLGSIRRRKRA